MEEKFPSLLSVAQVTRQKAQIFLKSRIWINYLSVFLSCTSLLLSIEIAWIFILTSGIFQLLSILIKKKSDSIHGLSREAQRRALLVDSFGKDTDDFNVEELYHRVGIDLINDAREFQFSGSYYSSEEPPGIQRFRDNIQESCFFSRRILSIEKNRLGWKIGITISTLIAFVIILSTEILPFLSNFDPVNHKYFLIAVFSVLIFIIYDDYDTLSKCVSAGNLFKNVDIRLDRILSEEELYSTYSDYCVASFQSTPIPTNTYIKLRSHFNEMWTNLRNKKKEYTLIHQKDGLKDEAFIIKSREARNRELHVLVDKLKLQLFENIEDITTNIREVSGWSGDYTYEIIFNESTREEYRAIIKFFRNKHARTNEIDNIQRLRKIGTDLFCFTIIDIDMDLENVLLYQHAIQKTQEPMLTVAKYLETNSNFINQWKFLDRLGSGVSLAMKTLDQLSEEYFVRQASDYVQSLTKNLIPKVMINIISTDETVVQDDLLILGNKGSFPNFQNIESIRLSKEHEFDNSLIKRENNWHRLDVTVKSWDSIDGTTVTDFVLKPSNQIIRVVANCDLYLTNVSTLIINTSDGKLTDLDSFINSKYHLDTHGIFQLDRIGKVIENVSSLDLKLSMRHSDFHAGNILISENHIRIIDLGDISKKPIFYDIARLEISVLSELININEINTGDVVQVYESFSGSDGSSELNSSSKIIYEILTAVRVSDNIWKTKPTDLEILLTYYLELLTQVSYMIYGNKIIPQQIIDLVQYFENKICNK